MVVLRFSRSWRNAGQESATEDVEELKQANVDEATSGLYFMEYCFDEDIIVHAVVDLFHRAFQKGLQLECLQLHGCRGRVDEILRLASSLDMFNEISIVGGSHGLSQHGFWSISSAMKYNKRLTAVNLSCMEMTRQQAAALGAGLITSNSQNHFKELHMERVTFADGAIGELASGLKHNSSLWILYVNGCNLGDVELAELVGAVESHPSLKELSLGWNDGQQHAMVALGKVLASKSCRLEELHLSHQGFNDNDHDGLSGHLGIFAQGLEGNESLTRLDLSNCELLDKDMYDLGQILATSKLEQLYLSRNRITHSGFVSFTKNIPKSLRSLDFSGNDFDQEEVACHILTLFEEHPQLLEDGFDWDDYKLPIDRKIQHFKDLNKCGRILLLTRASVIPLSVWPLVLARVNTVLSDNERNPNAIFHLLQGPALMQRRFDRDSSQCVVATSSKRGPAETIDEASAKKERSE
jgi:hypothetical protein